MESGPSRVNAPLEGPVIPRSRRDLFKDQSFGGGDNAGIKAYRSHAGETLHAKEEVGEGGGAHRGWCSVGERENGERLWVSALCLSEKTRRGGELSNNSQMIWAIPMR